MKKILSLCFLCLLLFIGCSKAENPSETAASPNAGTQSERLTDSTTTSAESISITDTSTNSAIDSVDNDMVEIKEKLFVTQTLDIYTNTEDYLGKTIKYEGIFDFYTTEDGRTYYYVIRYGPGCCGNDSTAGFEVVWDNDYPELNDWVEVIGILESYMENGRPYLRIQVTSLRILDERGAETVTM